jgi:hypothetical protein
MDLDERWLIGASMTADELPGLFSIPVLFVGIPHHRLKLGARKVSGTCCSATELKQISVSLGTNGVFCGHDVGWDVEVNGRVGLTFHMEWGPRAGSYFLGGCSQRISRCT